MIDELVKELRIDKEEGSFYYTWQSNIAMAFLDEYRRNEKKYKNHKDIHHIANEAAKNFLNLLIMDRTK